MTEIQRVTVYGSASSRIDPIFIEAGEALGEAIAARGWIQVNGGGRTGLMCAASDGGLRAGGEVEVVILEIFKERGFLHQGIPADKVFVEDNMPGRKKGLYERGDAYIGLPGGLGTYEELMEVLSWPQLGFHRKPIAMLNVDGFYDPLESLLLDSIRRGFVAEGFDSCWCITPDQNELLDWVAGYEPEDFGIGSKVGETRDFG